MTPTAALATVAVLVLPLAAAMAAFVTRRHGGVVSLAMLPAMALSCAALIGDVARHGGSTLSIGGWEAPLGITLRLDGLAAAFIALVALIMAAVLIYARGHFGPVRDVSRAGWGFWPLALLLWGALNAVALSRDLFNLYVGLELLTLAAIALVALEGRARTVAAALRYMMAALLGSLLYLLGAALVYAAYGTLDTALLAASDGRPAAAPLALTLMTVGLAIKLALFPFHGWLPAAHSGAPAPASALLSALVPKAAFYILLRLWFEAFPELASPGALDLLGLIGAAAILYGSVLAMRQDRLKMIVAYSTVAQLGYLMLMFPLAAGAAAAQPWAAGAWTGGIFHAVSHALAKASLFLCAGIFIRAVGHDRIDGLEGVARALPMTTFAFGLAAVTLMGLPPSGGFTAKYLMMTSAFAAGQPGWALVLAAGGLLAAIYLYRPMAMAFAREAPHRLAPVSAAAQWLPMLLALAAIGLGLFSNLPLEFLQIGRPEAAAEGLQ